MRILPSLFVLGLSALAPCQGDQEPAYRFLVTGSVSELQQRVLEAEYDVMECSARLLEPPFEVVVSQSQIASFYELGLDTRLLGEFQAASLPPPVGYFNLPAIEAEIDAVVAAHPTIAQKVNITSLPGGVVTWDGNSILALKLSDNVATDEDEPGIVLAAQHHAREVNSTYMVIGAMHRIADAYGIDPELTATVDGYEMYFIPCVNPDGTAHVFCCDVNWRKNRRNNGGSFGVDLNRNYPFLWGVCGASTNPASDTYRGPSAGSEPETQTMRALIANLRPEIYLDFHSSGREVLYLYPPCATVSPAIDALADAYVLDLRTAITPAYNTRLPSASGEAPHDFWATGGTMALLTEISTSFQPVFSSTVAEEARVWPGIEKAVTTWRPAINGHMRSIFQGQPIAGRISYSPNQFSHGEQIRARARDGRYAAWLPIGTWTVNFEAPGFNTVSTTVTVSSFNSTQVIDVDMTPSSFAPATLTKTGTDQIGTTTTLDYSSPGDAGAIYWVTLSGSDTPGLNLGGLRTVPLTPDSLMISMAFPNALLLNQIGTLPPSETATASLVIPNLPAIVGLTLFAGGLTIDTQYTAGIKKFTAATPITFQP